MGGSSTYGIEQIDGSIIYNIYRDTFFHDVILNNFMNGLVKEVLGEDLHYVKSIVDYYNEEKFEEEDSKVRAVLRVNGVLEYRFWGDENIFVYVRG
jgi:hypothetical protein